MTGYETFMKLYPMTLENLDGEEWKPLPDYEDYQVSNFGRVKSFKGRTPRIKAPQLSKKGYLCVMLCNNAKRKMCTVHRLVARLFVPNPLGKPEVNHIDGHPLNCHFSNLEWVTRSENNQHAYDMGLKQSGEDRSNAKLTAEQVRYIRNNPDDLNVMELAKMFSVAFQTINDVQLGKIWKQAGGVIRKARKVTYLPAEVQEQVRAEYKKGVVGYGSYSLAKKYGVSQATILRIVHESL